MNDQDKDTRTAPAVATPRSTDEGGMQPDELKDVVGGVAQAGEPDKTKDKLPGTRGLSGTDLGSGR
jgi:hypothetical protein